MKFSELESIMAAQNINILADIARALNATPQSVSNWKARDQVPHHIAAKINSLKLEKFDKTKDSMPNIRFAQLGNEDEKISFTDILLTLSEQLKIIFLIPFITVFFTFTYVKFMKQPIYESYATILIPGNNSGLGANGLSGIASQFGVNVGAGGSQADLSSPSLFPELLSSRTFAEKILFKKFKTEQYGEELSLLAILTHGDQPPTKDKKTLLSKAIISLNDMLKFEKSPSSTFSLIKVSTTEPAFSKELAEIALSELESLNRYYKSQTVREKTMFITNRISSVEDELINSEKNLKVFNEKNRQVSSPALQLEFDRLSREVEIKQGIFLTLKQQLELAKIEEIQETSIVQILDMPQFPIGPSNINLINSVLMAAIVGLFLGLLLSFLRAYLNSNNIDERRKLRKVKSFVKKKGKDMIFDRRIALILTVVLTIGLPFYLGHKSVEPVFFGRYSAVFMVINVFYILMLISSISILFITSRKK
jgi:uncharacterized protein involved in exopolysaccharide biosynthesis